MKRIKDKHITIRRATWDETPKGFFNQPWIIEYFENGNNFKQILNCGASDTIILFGEDHNYYILSYNESLGYAGLQYVGEEYDDNCYLDNLEDYWFKDEEILLDHLIEHLSY